MNNLINKYGTKIFRIFVVYLLFKFINKYLLSEEVF